MYEMRFLYDHAQAFAEERIASAERERALHRAHVRDRAASRLRKAVALCRRDGLDRGTVARELATLLRDRSEN
jgi:hypothetical protein